MQEQIEYASKKAIEQKNNFIRPADSSKPFSAAKSEHMQLRASVKTSKK